ncbi:ABC transporter [Thozetella sp. PMI_491]|nr:ABC transporter [Thozetella sp. PMI_491]
MALKVRLLVQMSGAPGSGKSTLANLLAHSIDGVVINHDLLRSFFLDNDTPFDQSAKLAYRFQWMLAGDMLRQGRSVIIDSTCNFQETLDQGIELARQHNCEYRYIECRVNDIHLLERRLNTRVALRSQRTSVTTLPSDAQGAGSGEDALVSFKKWMESPVRPSSAALVVDSTRSPEECLDYILKQLPLLTEAQEK